MAAASPRTRRQPTNRQRVSDRPSGIGYNCDPLTERGPVAQLGARMNGIHEVTGSIPVWSTILRSPIGELRLGKPQRVFHGRRMPRRSDAKAELWLESDWRGTSQEMANTRVGL